MFTKEACPFCVKAIDLFRSIGVEPILEVIDDSTKVETRDALSEISNGDNKLPR
jgi:glutaredoxin